MQARPGVPVVLTLVDLSSSSLRRAKRLAESLGIGHNVVCVNQDLKEFLANVEPGSIDILEMVGFLDYRTRSSVVRLVAANRRAVRPGGMMISAHIAPSDADFVTQWVIGWPGLVRRTPAEFQELLIAGDWNSEEIRMEVDDHDVHAVCFCRRFDG